MAVLPDSPLKASTFAGAITYCGRLAATKGIVIIIRAWAELESELGSVCPPLWIVGGTPEEIVRLRMQVDDQVALLAHERSGRLIWWGYQAPSGFSALLLRTLVFVSHSQYEPGGRVILESMAQGVCNIATPHGFALDLIQDGLSGYLVEFGDYWTLSLRLRSLTESPAKAYTMGANGRKIALGALHCWDFFTTHRAVYRALASRVSHAPYIPIPPPAALVACSALDRRRASR